MIFLITLICTGVLTALLQKQIKRWPIVFYAIAVIATGYYLYAAEFGAPVFMWRSVLPLFQRCIIAMALFTIVMFVSVFPEQSSFRAIYKPMRRELSILAFIFACGHIIAYSSTYTSQVLVNVFAMKTNVVYSLAVSCILTILLVVLTVTSVNAIHKRMDPKIWKRVQILSYPFYVLIFVHLFIVLMPSALAGSESIIINLMVYAMLLTMYVVFRIGKAVLDNNQAEVTAVTSE